MPLNESGNPARCNCWWPCGPCMDLEYSNVNCPSVVSTTSCRTTALASWASPTYSAKKKADWTSGYFATEIGTNATCDCSWQLYQYCKDDVGGTNGRAWVVEGDCHDNVANTTTHFGPAVVPDWTKACDYARYPFDLGFGGCCCSCGPPDCDCTPPSTLYMDVTGCWEASGVELTYDLDDGCWKQLTQISGQIDTAQLCCIDGAWTIQLTPINASCLDDLSTAATGGSCSPFSLTFPDITLSADCCDPSGGTISITVSE